MEYAVKSILFGTGGALIGGLYEVYQGTTDKSTQMVLTTKHTILASDRYLCSLVGRVEGDFIKSDHVALVKVIHALEELMTIANELESGKHAPNMKYRTRSFLCFHQVKSAIQRFVTTVEFQYRPRSVIRIQQIVKKIMECTEAYVTKVVMLTREIHMHV